MTEDQQKATDELIDAIESFWAPVIEEVTRRTGWSAGCVWSYQAMASIQNMERQINRLATAYETMARLQQETRPKTDKLMDLSLKVLKEQEDGDWKDDE